MVNDMNTDDTDDGVCTVCGTVMEWCTVCNEYTCFGCDDYGTCECC